MIQNIWEHTVFIRSLILVLGLLLISSYFAKKFILEVFPFALFRFLIIPGVIIHELSHALGCLITGAKVESIKVFDKEGGEVVHGEPYIKYIGPIIISMAPIVGGMLMFYLWTLLIDTPFQLDGNSSTIMSASESFISRLGQIKWFEWQIWVYLYGCLNLVICISPSTQDFTNCKWGLLIIFLAMGLIEYFAYFSGGSWASTAYRYFIPFILIAFFFMIAEFPLYLVMKKSSA